jgi:hypothetical protein
MSNPGKRRQPPPGTSQTTPVKRTSSASGHSPSPTAPARAASVGEGIPISALLNSPHPASSLPNQSQIPLRNSREVSPQRERAVQFQSTRPPEVQPDAAAGTTLGQFFNQYQSSLLPPSHPDGGIDAVLSGDVGFQPGRGAVPSSTPFHPPNTQQVGLDAHQGTGLSPGRSLRTQPGLPASFLHGGNAGLPPGSQLISPLPREGAGLPSQTRKAATSPPHGASGSPLSKQLMPLPPAPTGVERSGGADSQSSKSSIPPAEEPIGVLTTVNDDPGLSMQFIPQPSFPECVMFKARASRESSKATSSQSSQVGKGRKRMDYYRFSLLRDCIVLLHIAKHGQQELSKPRSEFTSANQTALFAQAVARIDFLINDAKQRAARLRQQFSNSYSPAMRELGTLTQGQYFYGPDVCKVFESYKEPRTRLHTLQAKVQMLMTGVIKTDAELDLYCECVLAIDEESRELLAESAFSATHHPVDQSTQSSQEGPPVPAASHTTASRGGPVAPTVGQPRPATGPRVRGGRFRRGGGLVRQTPVGPSRDSSSGSGGTQDARTTSSSVAPPVQGGGRQASVRGDDASQPGSPRVRIDSSVETGTQHAPSEVNKLVEAASAMVALRSSTETSERNLATLSAAAAGGPSGTSGPTPAPSSTAAQGSSSRPSGRNLASSPSTVQGGPSRTSGPNPATSSSMVQGDLNRTSGPNPAPSSTTAQGSSSRPSGRDLATSSSTVQGGPSRTSGPNPAPSSTAAQGSSSRPSGRDLATSSSTVQGGPSRTSGPNPAPSSTAAQGSSSRPSGPNPAPSSTAAQGSSSRRSGRDPAASSSTVRGGPSRTSGPNPALSSTTAQGSSSRPSGRNPAASSSTTQGGRSGGMREPIPAASSAASDDMTAWTNAATRALHGDPEQRP